MGKKDYPVQILNQSRGEIKDQYLSIEKAERILNWRPRYSLDEGLKETIPWYQTFFNAQ
jgi:CDP-glucose 4,6-dehydratase